MSSGGIPVLTEEAAYLPAASPPTDGVITVSYHVHSTSTAVSCSPSSVVVNQSMACTATVTDTETSGPITPAGTVSFTAAPTGEGVFSLSSCTLAAGTGASARCSVTYTPTVLGAGSQTIMASV